MPASLRDAAVIDWDCSRLTSELGRIILVDRTVVVLLWRCSRRLGTRWQIIILLNRRVFVWPHSAGPGGPGSIVHGRCRNGSKIQEAGVIGICLWLGRRLVE